MTLVAKSSSQERSASSHCESEYVQGSPISVAFDLVMPEGIAVDRRGRLVVVETGAQRLVRIDPATGAKELIASNLPVGIPAAPESPPQWIMNGVNIDRFGAI